MNRVDRSAISQAVAKAIAYRQCGKQELAEQWAEQVVILLQCHNILRKDR
jgi:hypothetical protein